MQIGKPGSGTTGISNPVAEGVTVRSFDLANDLIGHCGFSDYFYLLTAGNKPTSQQSFFLDACLVAIAEHGLTPTNIAARMTLAADPACLQGAVAAGILGCGTVVLGTAPLAFAMIESIVADAGPGGDLAAAARRFAQARRDERATLPGFGHPLHKPVDPRAARLIALAKERGTAGRGVAVADALGEIAAHVWNKPLPMNVSMAIAATLYDVGAPRAIVRGLPIVARAASLIAHLAEEEANPIGFRMAAAAESAIRYDGPETPPHDA